VWGGGMMSGHGLRNQQPTLQRQSAFKGARLFLLGIWNARGMVLGHMRSLFTSVKLLGMQAWVIGWGFSFACIYLVSRFALTKILLTVSGINCVVIFVSINSVNILEFKININFNMRFNIECPITFHLAELLFKLINSLRSIFYAFGSSNYNFVMFFIGIGNIWGRCLFFISSAIMLSLTIYLTLLAQGIERQPGPMSKGSCNGLGDLNKLKRLLLKLYVLVDKGCIVFLQEMHIDDTTYLEMIWKHSFLFNCVNSNLARVIIL
jgi:hypothetical protein